MTAPSTFEDVISAWHEQIRCEMSTQLGARCRRPARRRPLVSVDDACRITPL
jgi:hypothetical protein